MTRTNTKSEITESALVYASQNFAVIPLAPNTKIPQKGSHGYKDGCKSSKKIEEMWAASPSSNIGVVTGVISGIIVIDIDVKNNNDGMSSFSEMCGDHDIPNTRTVRSPSGGYHYYFLLPEGWTIGSPIGVRPGVDIRCEGTHIVAPPSRIGDADYQWVDETVEIIELPSWLQELLEERSSPGTAQETVSLDNVLDGVSEGQRNDTLFRYSAQQRAKGLTRDEAYTLVQKAGRNCEPPFPPGELDKCFSQGWSYQPNYALTEVGNAKRLIKHFGDELKYVNDQGWYVWDRSHSIWKRNDMMAAYLAQTTVELIGAEVKDADDVAYKRELQKHYTKSQTDRMFRAMLSIAKSNPEMRIEASDLDADLCKLQVTNGLLNLRTGRLEEHNPADYITKGINIVHDESAVCLRFKNFLSEIFQSDNELIEYVQRAVGYTLTGSNQEQSMFLMYGDGSNGKSVLLNILSALLGDHCVAAPPQMLVGKSRNSSNDLARLKGARLLTLSEESAGSKWDEALVKLLTGDDKMSARALYKEFEDFKVTAKMWMATNHLPRIIATDHAIWRRLRVIPFNYTVSSAEVDRTLFAKLQEELPGILNWALEGCIRWQEDKLDTCPTVDNATAEHRYKTDPMRQWLDEKVASIPGKRTKASVLYGSCKEFCSAAGPAANETIFGREMKKRGYKSSRARDGNYYNDIEIKCVPRRRRRRKQTA